MADILAASWAPDCSILIAGSSRSTCAFLSAPKGQPASLCWWTLLCARVAYELLLDQRIALASELLWIRGKDARCRSSCWPLVSACSQSYCGNEIGRICRFRIRESQHSLCARLLLTTSQFWCWMELQLAIVVWPSWAFHFLSITVLSYR